MIENAHPGYNKFMAKLLVNDYTMAFMRGYDAAIDAANRETMAIPCPYLIIEDAERYQGWSDGFDCGRQYIADIFSGISWRKSY